MSKAPYTGQAINRIEGPLKVTGKAKYAAEYDVQDLLHSYVVNAKITKGRIASIDTSEAEKIPGVIRIFTHENRPSLAWFDFQYADMDAPPGKVFKPLSDDRIKYNGQPIALVVADDFETARYAASLVKVEYEQEPHATKLESNLDKARDPQKGLATALKPPPPKPTGDFETAYENSAFTQNSIYRHGTEHHNPIELFASTVVYEGKGKITIYDKTQGTVNNQVYVANVFGLRFKDVRVVAPFVGGGFGSGLRPQYQLFLCVMAALELKRNVRLTLDRKQMFAFGHRPQTVQELKFATDENGKLTAMHHKAIGETSTYEDYAEIVVPWSHKLYPCENTLFEYQLAPLDLASPIDMRAPGGVTGMPAIECMMDELAFQLKIDPLEFRLKNYSEIDPSSQKPFTSKALRECYLEAAKKFGWEKRNPQPGKTVDGNRLIGYGMATGIWDAYQFPTRIRATLTKDAKLAIDNATTDIGTGTLTIMTQMAADQMGLKMSDVNVSYGDSKMPFSMFQGGSAMTASVSAGIVVATKDLRKKIVKIVSKAGIKGFEKANEESVLFQDGRILLKSDPKISISLSEVIRINENREIKTTKLAGPKLLKLRKYSMATHSAAFVEVEIDRQLKTITVKKVTTAIAAGKIINPKTAGSQIKGSIIWGMSKALYEETILDENLGKYMNANLGEYHIPVHADIPEIDVIFVDEKDGIINELGVKGVGEIGIVAVPAAIANAIFNATGKRLYDLPIHFDALFE
ncbi:xanthine dehydrogenase family protein molybdopterin-binding subunit [Flavobacterium sp.]|uniref:xanthine dehydrogenase family protein molybdopterin-binding subunit n=1 Tax=Flavobacterium sp. TaxID=239 RepID=UPI00120E7E0D|nr:xanthine dehydrogenase family protein molybdopterin-binding subunit [Flavobacterium sp.]RZJ73052.1 MAG: xanthine dehydrogenase family protein molybdopterin-binding subunit [Flavobacterium sp.]